MFFFVTLQNWFTTVCWKIKVTKNNCHIIQRIQNIVHNFISNDHNKILYFNGFSKKTWYFVKWKFHYYNLSNPEQFIKPHSRHQIKHYNLRCVPTNWYFISFEFVTTTFLIQFTMYYLIWKPVNGIENKIFTKFDELLKQECTWYITKFPTEFNISIKSLRDSVWLDINFW